MRVNKTIVFVVLAGVMFCLLAGAAVAADKFKLKPGARGTLCLECHTAFSAKMQEKYIHTPLVEGECSGCHNPHTSNHGMLMETDADSICYRCHDSVVPDNSVSSHAIVAEGQCVTCHDPHASANPANLVRGGRDLCFGCHKELGAKIAANKFGHTPVEQDCMECHTPHASEQNHSLLKAEEPGLCLDCHDISSRSFKSLHMNYPVEQGRCSTCHDPHGSSSGAILADNVHMPIKKQMCNQCHNEPDSTEPFAVKKQGYELCQGCHYDMINDAFAKDRLHWPLADVVGCMNCHTPHASAQDSLLKAPMKQVCGDCHADTLARQDRSASKHQPVNDGECMICHSPHASDNLFLSRQESTIESCGDCHDWQAHSTHPIGAEVIDPRNQNIELDCLSCHRTHGTEYKHFIYYPDIQSLCVQCHTKYRR